MRPQFAHALRVSARKNPVVPAKVRGRRRDAQRLVSPIFEPLEGRQLLSTTYYVSPSGSDTGPGNSSAQPWKSITRVNNATLHAGDKVLFQGGQTFAGSIYVPSTEGGTASSPVVFSTYGSGRATINSGSARGFDLRKLAALTSAISILSATGCTTTHHKGSAFMSTGRESLFRRSRSKTSTSAATGARASCSWPTAAAHPSTM